MDADFPGARAAPAPVPARRGTPRKPLFSSQAADCIPLFRRELLQPKLVERTLCRAVPVDLLLMLVQELFRVTGGFVLLKNLPRAGIIENVPPQYVDLRQPLLRRVHPVQKLAAMRRCFVRFLRQHIV